jgi:hypothetical protein
MKLLLLSSFAVALCIGSLIGFVVYVTAVPHQAVKYEPPLTEGELKHLNEISVQQAETELRGRRIMLTRAEWLEMDIGEPYFWKSVAQNSVVPISGVFAGCLCVGWFERRRSRGR